MSEPPSTALPTQAWSPGAGDFPVLLGQYRIVGVLGQGGMGTVFKGYHLKLRRFVAIKTLRLDHVRRPNLAQRFGREMGAVGQMDHPNVVRAFDAGERNGVLYLVMEYLAGIDLERLLARRGPLAPADACALARQAALGLDHLHQAIVHRDVKPSNLMLTPSGVVKILDLGLARLDEPDPGAGEQTPEGQAIGTYDYIAPEQALGARTIDGRADIYSLGCTLFKLLTGRAPFQGTEYASVPRKLFAHCHTPLDALPGFAELSPPLAAVLLRMTAKDPAQRYATAREVAEALAPLAAGDRPEHLLPQSCAEDEAARPLPAQAPEEINRLTEVPLDTPLHTPASGGTSASTLLSMTSRRMRRVLAVLLLVVALAVPVVMIAPSLLRRPADRPDADPVSTAVIVRPNRPEGPPALRPLDTLAARQKHPLLDQRPVVVGCAWDDPQWRWDEKLQTVTVTAPDNLLLFQLGTTSRPNFTLDVMVRQAPWTGGVGVFWGYREDAAVKAARKPQVPFAWFQMVCLWREIQPKTTEERFFMRRAHVTLNYSPRGTIVPGMRFLARQDVEYPPRGREALLRIEVAQERLKGARFDALPLKGLHTEPVNDLFKAEPATGILGTVSLSASTTFSNVWFVANP